MNLPPPLDLSGRTALITGSTRGLGASAARCLAGLGATVAINGRDPAVVAQRCREIEASGGSALEAAFDVTDRTAIADAVAGIAATRGGLDILVANAAFYLTKPVEQTSDDELESLFATKFSSAFVAVRCAIPHMKARGWGRIVLVSSIGVIASGGRAPADAAASGALATLAKAVSTSLAPHGITCNAVAPGFIDTEMTQRYRDEPGNAAWIAGRVPAGRWGRPDEIGWPIAFLSTEAASFITGHTLIVDGGITSSY